MTSLIPGLFLLIVTYFSLPTKEKIFKLFVLILGFILMRDAMTPAGIWEFGIQDGVMWLRFVESHFILLTIAVFSVFLSLVILRFHGTNFSEIKWFGNRSPFFSVVMGVIGSMIAAGPFVLPYFFTPMAERGGMIPAHLLISLLIFTLCGNFLEEVLFRELLQDYLNKHVGTMRAILLSALFFALGHVFLATTVTNLGPLILMFTFWEGLVCAWIKPKFGILSATVAHGLTIFILSSGII